MPMYFNLFGSLATDPDLAAQVVGRWFPDLCSSATDVSVTFEWSPGRRQQEWLGDRTAFDVAISVATPSSRALIGIETKYHEHPTTEPLTRRSRTTGEIGPRLCPDRYVEVSEQAGLLGRADIERDIWGTTAEQIWRDHLLALACNQHANGWNPARYVLVAPGGEPGVARAG